MHARIKELVVQSGFDTWSDTVIVDGVDITRTVENLAELIVRKCLFIIDDERKPEMVSRIELWKQVKEHFGVEE